MPSAYIRSAASSVVQMVPPLKDNPPSMALCGRWNPLCCQVWTFRLDPVLPSLDPALDIYTFGDDAWQQRA